MPGFEWWTGSWGQWLFVGLVVVPIIASAIVEKLARPRKDDALGLYNEGK